MAASSLWRLHAGTMRPWLRHRYLVTCIALCAVMCTAIALQDVVHAEHVGGDVVPVSGTIAHALDVGFGPNTTFQLEARDYPSEGNTALSIGTSCTIRGADDERSAVNCSGTWFVEAHSSNKLQLQQIDFKACYGGSGHPAFGAKLFAMLVLENCTLTGQGSALLQHDPVVLSEPGSFVFLVDTTVKGYSVEFPVSTDEAQASVGMNALMSMRGKFGAQNVTITACDVINGSVVVIEPVAYANSSLDQHLTAHDSDVDVMFMNVSFTNNHVSSIVPSVAGRRGAVALFVGDGRASEWTVSGGSCEGNIGALSGCLYSVEVSLTVEGHLGQRNLATFDVKPTNMFNQLQSVPGFGGSIFAECFAIACNISITDSEYSENMAGAGGSIWFGGDMAFASHVTVKSTTVSHSTTTLGGGGMAVMGFAGTDLVPMSKIVVHIDDVQLHDNFVNTSTVFSPAVGHGGGVLLYNVTGRIEDALFVSNNATGYGGGAIVSGCSSVNATRVELAKNSAEWGGGLFLGQLAVAESVTLPDTCVTAAELRDVKVWENTGASETGSGGGLSVIFADISAVRLDVWNNSAPVGGGIVMKGGSLASAYSSIEKNRAFTAGASVMCYRGADEAKHFGVMSFAFTNVDSPVSCYAEKSRCDVRGSVSLADDCVKNSSVAVIVDPHSGSDDPACGIVLGGVVEAYAIAQNITLKKGFSGLTPEDFSWKKLQTIANAKPCRSVDQAIVQCAANCHVWVGTSTHGLIRASGPGYRGLMFGGRPIDVRAYQKESPNVELTCGTTNFTVTEWIARMSQIDAGIALVMAEGMYDYILSDHVPLVALFPGDGNVKLEYVSFGDCVMKGSGGVGPDIDRIAGGACLQSYCAQFSLTSVTFSDCTALCDSSSEGELCDLNGGAVFAKGSAHDPFCDYHSTSTHASNISNVQFSACKSGGAGGAIFVNGANFSTIDVSVSESEAAFGGAVSVVSNSSASKFTLERLKCSDNVASESGGCLFVSGRVDVNVFNSTLAHGHAHVGGGLAAACTTNCSTSVHLDSVEFDGNVAGGVGGSIFATGVHVSASNITVINSQAGSVELGAGGGGLHISNSTIDVDGMYVAFSRADGNGGGLSFENVEGSMWHVEVQNTTSVSDGGGVFLDMSPVSSCGVAVCNSTAWNGGGVAMVREGLTPSPNCDEVSLGHCPPVSNATASVILSHNTAKNLGGGLYYGLVDKNDQGGDCAFKEALLVGNSAREGGGAAGVAACKLTNILVKENSAAIWGGGIYAAGVGVTLHSSVEHASASRRVPPPDTVVLQDVAFEDNVAGSYGGAVAAWAINVDLGENVTFHGNRAPYGDNVTSLSYTFKLTSPLKTFMANDVAIFGQLGDMLGNPVSSAELDSVTLIEQLFFPNEPLPTEVPTSCTNVSVGCVVGMRSGVIDTKGGVAFNSVAFHVPSSGVYTAMVSIETRLGRRTLSSFKVVIQPCSVSRYLGDDPFFDNMAVCLPCISGSYALRDDAHCHECPANAYCPIGQGPVSIYGHYFYETGRRVYPCWWGYCGFANRCRLEGHEGFICGDCKEGWELSAYRCVPCEEAKPRFLGLFGVTMLALAIFIIIFVQGESSSYFFALAFFGQAFAIVYSISGVARAHVTTVVSASWDNVELEEDAYPFDTDDSMAVWNMFLFSINDLFPNDCAMGRTVTSYKELMIALEALSPLVFTLFVQLVFLFVLGLGGLLSKSGIDVVYSLRRWAAKRRSEGHGESLIPPGGLEFTGGDAVSIPYGMCGCWRFGVRLACHVVPKWSPITDW